MKDPSGVIYQLTQKNARLQALNGELLAALKAVVKADEDGTIDGDYRAMQEVKAAIAKAEGK